MNQSEYKERITSMSNLILTKEHFMLHLDNKGNVNKHSIVAGEMMRRGMRHLIKKDNKLDAAYLKAKENLKKK